MNSAELRRSMTAGIAFVILFVAGVFVFLGNTPTIKSNDTDAIASAKFVKQLSSSGHRVGLIISAYLLILAGTAFIWFTSGLRSRSASPIGARMVSALGVLGAGALAAGAMAVAVVAGAVSLGSEPVPQNGDAMRVVMDLAFPFFFVVFGLVSAAIIATIAATGRTSGLPSWFLNLAWVAVLGAVLGVIFIPIILPLLWFVVVAILGLRGPAVDRAESTGSAKRPSELDSYPRYG